MISLGLDREEFAARRRAAQDRLVESLSGVVGAFLSTGNLSDLRTAVRRLYLAEYAAETDKAPRLRDMSKFLTSVERSLDKTTSESDVHVTSLGIALAILNAATISAAAAEGGEIVMEWVTMHDDKVRESHRDVSGDQRPVGEPFTVDGVDMPYPGYMLAPPELWIGCRCVLRPALMEASLTAAADVTDTTLCIVAVPAASDAVHEIGPEEKHATLVYFGEVVDEGVIATITEWTAHIAADAQPFDASVKELGELGHDDGPKAQVWLLEDSDLNGIHEGLLEDDVLRTTHEDADITHYPEYTPHVTIGYPPDGDAPAVADEDMAAADSVEQITFDRLAVWHGDNRNEFPLGEDMADDDTPEITDEAPVDAPQGSDVPVDERVPWHGVLAPEGVKSGDGRMFTNLGRTRELPLPLTWQEKSAGGHDDSITVAMIEKAQMIDGLMHASGHFLNGTVDEADEVIGLIAEFGKFGVSVDADDIAEMSFDEEAGVDTFDDPRVCSASIVSIPAFAEAFVALGPHPVLDAEPDLDEEEDDLAEGGDEEEFRDVSQDERDERADDGTAMPDGSYPIANCEDLKNAIQAIGRAKDPEATKKHIRKRANALDCPDVDLPEDWAAEASLTPAEMVASIAARAEAENWSDVVGFKDLAPGITEDGPGWLTHPVDTDRLRDYWVRGPGAAKIGWGAPGDFNRCRLNLAEYVKPQYLSGYCANRHYDALGVWPGQEASAHETLELSATDPAPAVSVVAGGGWSVPSAWFEKPDVPEGEGIVIEPDGRTYGYIAEWGVCHVGMDGVCVEAPPSASNYAYFRTGSVTTDDGKVVEVACLTYDTDHAGARLAATPAMAHYADTGKVWALVACGEDDRGIWFSGITRPGIDEGDLNLIKATGRCSGDWRRIGNSLELVAAIAVPSPGFPITKSSLVAGVQVSLIAAGMVGRKDENKPDPVPLDLEHLAAAVVDEMESRTQRRERMEALKQKVGN
jgi:2'-5' RNA ligase